MKAVDLITRALKAIGNIGSGEVPTAPDANDSLEILNEMLDSWSTSSTLVFCNNEESFPLQSNKGVYSMGQGGDFPTVRPVDIQSVYVRLGAVDYPVQIIDNDAYSSIATKSTTGGIPRFLYINPTAPLLELCLWPVPQDGQALFIQSSQQLTQFPDLTTDVLLVPGYAEAIRLSLIPRLAAEGLGVAKPEAIEIAKASVARIRSINSRVPVLRPGYGNGRSGNILNGYR
jgi:hypothetical protein